jgi:hypothetical protein
MQVQVLSGAPEKERPSAPGKGPEAFLAARLNPPKLEETRLEMVVFFF